MAAMTHPFGLTVLLPIWNERISVVHVIQHIACAEIGRKQLLVVDDGSTDGTSEQLLEVQAAWRNRNAASFVMLRHEKRRGKGAAIRTAIPYCRGEVTIIQDADFEYDPSEYPRLMRPILDGRAEVVYGSRFRGSIEGMRWPNRIVNHVLTWLANALYDANITDEATCYKAFRTTLAPIAAVEMQAVRVLPGSDGPDSQTRHPHPRGADLVQGTDPRRGQEDPLVRLLRGRLDARQIPLHPRTESLPRTARQRGTRQTRRTARGVIPKATAGLRKSYTSHRQTLVASADRIGLIRIGRRTSHRRGGISR